MKPIIEKIKLHYLNFARRIGRRFLYFLKRDLSDCESILDLGCGWNSPVRHCDAPFKVGVELFDPYLEEAKKNKIHNQYIKADVTEVEFKPRSFDAVVMADVLEHLTKEDGYKLLKKMEIWAKKKIIILTPNEFIENDLFNGNRLQEHRSGWSVDELKKAGFKVRGCNGWKPLKGKATLLKYKPWIFWETISRLSQEITYFFPKLAWHLYAVKELDPKNPQIS